MHHLQNDSGIKLCFIIFFHFQSHSRSSHIYLLHVKLCFTKVINLNEGFGKNEKVTPGLLNIFYE